MAPIYCDTSTTRGVDAARILPASKGTALPGKQAIVILENNVAVRSKFLFKGTGTSEEKRDQLNLRGLLPPVVESTDVQKRRVMKLLSEKSTPLEKYMLLGFLRNTNATLFYTCLLEHLEEIMPIIYTPTVGTACARYSDIYPFLSPPGVSDGLFVSHADINRLDEIFTNWQADPAEPNLTPLITVITDGSRILGLGDLGAGGMGIPVGKLQLYSAAAGIDPRRTLPIMLDLGTDNEDLLKDELYIGNRRKRLNEREFHAFMDSFLAALRAKWPNILVQFEDFSSKHALELLHRHRERYFCFNDDIQGTGAVILAGLINAIRLSGMPAKDHNFLFFGAGSAAIGVARLLMEFLIREAGMSENEARRRIWLMDSKGLVTADRGDKLAEHRIFFARTDNKGVQAKTLDECIDYVRPTALIGLSSQHGAFNEERLRKMKALNKRPIVFPLSNPADASECDFETAMRCTSNNVLFASGTGFPPYRIPGTDLTKYPDQGNNMYCFPGIGAGAILARPPKITDGMIYASARAVADSLNDEEKNTGQLYPRIKRIRDVSSQVAAAVCKKAAEENMATDEQVMKIFADDSRDDAEKDKALLELVKSRMWSP